MSDYLMSIDSTGKCLCLGQTLRFIRTDSQTDKQNFHNRLINQESYRFFQHTDFYQKFYVGDPILVQIITNYSTHNIYLVNLETGAETDLTANWSTIKTWTTDDYSTVTCYNNTISTSSIAGWYYVKLAFNGDIVYKSESFHVHTRYSNYPYLSWTHSHTSAMQKGIYFSGVETFGMRVDGEIMKYEPGLNRKTQESFNNIVENITTDALFFCTLYLGPLPRYLIEKINVSLQFDTWKINDIQYELDGEFQTEFIKGTDIYTGSLRLRKRTYENYTDLENEAENETYRILSDSQPTAGIIMINSTDYLTFY